MRTGFYILLFYLLQSCSPHVAVTVDSISLEDAKTYGSFEIVNGNASQDNNDLYFRELATLASKTLYRLGFVKATADRPADTEITIKFGTTARIDKKLRYEPVYGKTGTKKIKTKSGLGREYSEKVDVVGLLGFQNRTYYSEIFDNNVTLSGRSIHGAPLWSVSITVTGSNDIRKYSPFILKLAERYIAKSSGKKLSFTISEDEMKKLVKQ